MAKTKEDAFDPQKYMQMAIDEMKESVAETRDDGKISPKVGAVLLFPDGTVTRKQYQDAFEIENDKKAERHLRKLTELGLIRRIGSGRSVYYEIIPT